LIIEVKRLTTIHSCTADKLKVVCLKRTELGTD